MRKAASSTAFAVPWPKATPASPKRLTAKRSISRRVIRSSAWLFMAPHSGPDLPRQEVAAQLLGDPRKTCIKRGSSCYLYDMKKSPSQLRSKAWFDNPDNIDMTALYLERYLNYGFTRGELQSGK